jgi:uncharacterized protein (DUF58 family)
MPFIKYTPNRIEIQYFILLALVLINYFIFLLIFLLALSVWVAIMAINWSPGVGVRVQTVFTIRRLSYVTAESGRFYWPIPTISQWSPEDHHPSG